jgi:hypothetical protein
LTPPKQANRNSQIETLVPRGTIKNEKEKIGGVKTKINGMRLKTKIRHCALLKKNKRKLKGKRTKIDFSWKYTKHAPLSWLIGDGLLIMILLFGYNKKISIPSCQQNISE